jgi:hypothetical protein
MRANIAPAAGRAADLAQATPESRDRYVDFLRIASILVVVLGHWLMAVVVWPDDGIHVGNVLGMVPLLWLATWVLQVMPVFFFVGGFANLVTLDGLRRRGRGSTEYLAGRGQRLVRPVAVLLAVWVPVAFVANVLGADPKVLGDATKVVCQPLWFIGVYLMVSALAPPLRDLHTRHRVRVLVALAALAIVVDVARFAGGIDAIAWANMLFVWLFAQQLGFFYADGTLGKCTRPVLWAGAGSALAALLVLTTFGPYPRSMVGLPGERVSNMAPPTICLLALTVLQVALVMLARDAVSSWLQRARVWTGVVAGNGVIMTIFLWHLSALLVTVLVLFPIGFPQAAGGSALWWATRPLWLACAALPLAAFVTLFGRFERPRPVAFVGASTFATWRAGVGTALLGLGISGIASGTLRDILHGNARLVVVDLSPVQAMALAGAGWLLLRGSVHDEMSAAAIAAPVSRRSPDTPTSSADRGS